jgi:hypothetical protein
MNEPREENRVGGFEGTFQTLVMIRDIAVHNMRHTQGGQFFLSGYALWISVTIKQPGNRQAFLSNIFSNTFSKALSCGSTEAFDLAGMVWAFS